MFYRNLYQKIGGKTTVVLIGTGHFGMSIDFPKEFQVFWNCLFTKSKFYRMIYIERGDIREKVFWRKIERGT